ncbi:MAG: twin-arginine translocase TatA/TatE family subunit [Bacteriovoracia bacterium]
MFGLGMGELILILLIALIFIGPKKLPELAKGLGKGIRDFQNAAKGFTDQLQEDEHKTPPQVTDASQQESEKTAAPTETSEEKDKDSTPS